MDDAQIAVVGAGTVGSHLIQKLAGHNLHIIDQDLVAERNLATSALYTAEHVTQALPKAMAARDAVDGEVTAAVARLDAGNADDLLAGADIIIDATDNLATRFHINRYCAANRVPWVHTAALQDIGQVLPLPPDGPCFACIFGHAQEADLDDCDTAGIDRTTAQTTAHLAAALARQLAAGAPVTGLYRVDGQDATTTRLAVRPRADCAACSGAAAEQAGGRGLRVRALCGSTYHIESGPSIDVNPYKIAENFDETEKVTVNNTLVRIDRGGGKMTIFASGRALVAADNRDAALAQYREYVEV